MVTIKSRQQKTMDMYYIITYRTIWVTMKTTQQQTMRVDYVTMS